MQSGSQVAWLQWSIQDLRPEGADNSSAKSRPSCLFCYSRPWRITSVQDYEVQVQGQLVKSKAIAHLLQTWRAGEGNLLDISMVVMRFCKESAVDSIRTGESDMILRWR
jgi:hypothetical protein